MMSYIGKSGSAAGADNGTNGKADRGEKARRGPVRSGYQRPSSGDRAERPDWEEFAPDSPLEGDGFEPSVPHKKQPFLAAPVRSRNSPSATKTGSFVPGTDGSNPSPSTGESCPNGEAA